MLRPMDFAIPGAPTPIPNRTLARPEDIPISGSGASVSREIVRQLPAAPGRTLEQTAELPADERQRYIRETGEAATRRQEQKIIDILV